MNSLFSISGLAKSLCPSEVRIDAFDEKQSCDLPEMEHEMSELPFAVTTPVSVQRVGLKARDADALSAYYRKVVGLTELSRANGAISLGAGGRALLEIEGDHSARPDDPGSAGLFHTAFLLPTRADLG